jgi:hypothetical protein
LAGAARVALRNVDWGLILDRRTPVVEMEEEEDKSGRVDVELEEVDVDDKEVDIEVEESTKIFSSSALWALRICCII